VKKQPKKEEKEVIEEKNEERMIESDV